MVLQPRKKNSFITMAMRTSNAYNLAPYQMQFHKYRSAPLTSILHTFMVHTAITQLFCNFHWSSQSLTTKLNQITVILRCPCQGPATLNMLQYRHYNKENENQCSTNVGRFILLESGVFFSAANITFEVKLKLP